MLISVSSKTISKQHLICSRPTTSRLVTFCDLRILANSNTSLRSKQWRIYSSYIPSMEEKIEWTVLLAIPRNENKCRMQQNNHSMAGKEKKTNRWQLGCYRASNQNSEPEIRQYLFFVKIWDGTGDCTSANKESNINKNVFFSAHCKMYSHDTKLRIAFISEKNKKTETLNVVQGITNRKIRNSKLNNMSEPWWTLQYNRYQYEWQIYRPNSSNMNCTIRTPYCWTI